MWPRAKWVIVAAAFLVAGAVGARSYAQLTAPYYRATATLMARGHPWTIGSIDVVQESERPGTFLRLSGDVRRALTDTQPAAVLATRVQAGAVIEGPLVFWTVLLLWPAASTRRRLGLFACAIPIFATLEMATTTSQLLNGFAEASAMLRGDQNPVTPWDRWSRFIDSGGRDVLAICGALMVIAIASRLSTLTLMRGTRQ